MSKRLQVLLEPTEYRGFQHVAKEAGLSLGEWVRQILRNALISRSIKNPEQKLKAIRRFSRYEGPTGDIGVMLKEIEKGYLGE